MFVYLELAKESACAGCNAMRTSSLKRPIPPLLATLKEGLGGIQRMPWKNASYFVFSAGSSRMICLTETPHISTLSNQMRAMYQPSIRVLGCDRIQIFCCTNPVSRWCGIKRGKRRRRGKSWERRTKSWRKKLNFWCRRRCNEETRSTIEPKEMFIKRNVTGYFHISIWYLAMGGKYCFIIFFFLEYFYSFLEVEVLKIVVRMYLGCCSRELPKTFEAKVWFVFYAWCLVEIMKFFLGQDSEVYSKFWCLVEILKLMLGLDSEDEIWSRFL